MVADPDALTAAVSVWDAGMQTCRHAVMQTCRRADVQTCRYADVQGIVNGAE